MIDTKRILVELVEFDNAARWWASRTVYVAQARSSEALRQVLAVHHRDQDGNCAGCGWSPKEEPAVGPTDDCPTVMAIAAALGLHYPEGANK